MSAYIEVCYERSLEQRMRQTLDFEAFDLWAEPANITLHLEWETDNSGMRQLFRILVFAIHRNLFASLGVLASVHFKTKR